MAVRNGLLESPNDADHTGCLLLQVLAVVEDESRCRAATGLLLDRACRRWSGRSDCSHFPPVERWRAVEPGSLGGAESLPERLIAAAAAGQRPESAGLAQELQVAVVLHAGCPVVAIDTELPDSGTGALADSLRHALLLSMYGLREDDLSLAESVVNGCAVMGALQLVDRFTRWVPLPAPDGVPGAGARPLTAPQRIRVAAGTARGCADVAGPDPAVLRRG